MDLEAAFAQKIPPIDQFNRSMHHTLACFLAAIKFTVHGASGASEELVVGKNLFVDFLPDWFRDLNAIRKRNPGNTWVLIYNEPVALITGQSHNHKLDSIAVIETHHSNRDRAAQDISRLFHFFLRRENVIQFVQLSEVAVHLVQPTEVPSPAGEDDNGRVVYSFRVQLRGRVDN